MPKAPSPLTPEQQAAIRRLYCEEGLNTSAVASRLHVSAERVRHFIWDNHLVRQLKAPKTPQTHARALWLAKKIQEESSVPQKARMPEKAPKDRPNPVAVATATLGKRLEERGGGFWMDGRPARFLDVMRETNRIRQACGWTVLDVNPLWRAE